VHGAGGDDGGGGGGGDGDNRRPGHAGGIDSWWGINGATVGLPGEAGRRGAFFYSPSVNVL